MPVYNGQAFIQSGIQGVLRQSFSDWELIIVDDGSTDRTPELVTSFMDSRVRFVRQDNAGPVTARNHGLGLARGRYVIFLDCDDWWTPNGLGALVLVAQAHEPEPVIVHGDWAYATSPERVGDTQSSCFKYGPGLHTLVRYNPFCIHAVLVPTRVLHEIGGFTQLTPSLEDWELWQTIALRGFVYRHVPLLVAVYFWHAGSRSKDAAKRKVERLASLDRFWAREDVPENLQSGRGTTYATAHIDFCVAEFCGDNDVAAWAEFDSAVKWDASIVTDIDTYYRIAFTDQAASEHGRSQQVEVLDSARASRHIERLVAHIQSSREPAFVKIHRAMASATAWYALGLAHYNQHNNLQARRMFLRSATASPRLFFNGRLLWTATKSMFPQSLLELLRKTKSIASSVVNRVGEFGPRANNVHRI